MFKRALIVVLLLAGVMVPATRFSVVPSPLPTPVAAQGGTDWDEAICNGEEAVVWRVVNGTTSDLPTVEGCNADDANGWLLVEPWGPNGNNWDRACFAETWGELYEVAVGHEWLNGSAWRSPNDTAEDPLVVQCSAVKNDSQLGLNPWEGQVELRTIDKTVARAAILLLPHDMTLADYAEQNPDLPISVLFNLLADYGISE